MAMGFLEGLDEGFEVGEVLGEGGELWVFGEGVAKLPQWRWEWFSHPPETSSFWFIYFNFNFLVFFNF